MIKNWRQFFEGEKNQLSITRLLCFLSFFPATVMATRLNTENALTIYVGCYALSYLGGKMTDVAMKSQEKKDVPTE